VWRDGEVLLVRHEKGSRSYWLVPGGGVDTGETMVAAGAREVLEETGYSVEMGPLLLVCEAIDPNPAVAHRQCVYAGTVRGGTLTVGVDDKSLRDAQWHPVEALGELEMYPPIGAELLVCCGRTAAARFASSATPGDLRSPGRQPRWLVRCGRPPHRDSRRGGDTPPACGGR